MFRSTVFAFAGLGALAVFTRLDPAAVAQQFQEQTADRFPDPNPSDYTNYIEVGDLDADGDLDLVFANGGGFSSAGAPQPVRVYINDGAGAFADESDRRVNELAGNFRGVALGDADGDGDLDIALASDFNRQPRLLVNDGDGFFDDETDSRLPTLLLSSTRGQFADIDDDGDLDLYFNHGGPVNRFGCGQSVVLVNDGSGMFTDETAFRHPLGNVCEPMDVIFADIDGDFDLDIRTGNRGSGNSRLYRNSGDGTFEDISGFVPPDSACYSYDLADMNGDGNLDMIGANAGPSNRELLLIGDGTGHFTDVSSQLVPNTTGDDNDSKFFDLDDDGDLDLVIASLFQGREKIYINDGTGVFALDTERITSNNDATLDVAVADFDGDGRLDIVTAQGEAGAFQNRIYMNVTGPVDTHAPLVVRTRSLTDGCGPFVVRAAVTDGVSSDRGFFDAGVELRVSIDGAAETAVPMQWVGNSICRAVLPEAALGAELAYRVAAMDRAGNQGFGVVKTVHVVAPSPDLDGNGVVDVSDLLAVLAAWGPCTDPCGADLDCDGDVGVTDLLAILSAWG